VGFCSTGNVCLRDILLGHIRRVLLGELEIPGIRMADVLKPAQNKLNAGRCSARRFVV
jgi:hypothetical protein